MGKPLINFTYDPSQTYAIIDKNLAQSQLPCVNISFNSIDGLRSSLQINTLVLFKKLKKNFAEATMYKNAVSVAVQLHALYQVNNLVT